MCYAVRREVPLRFFDLPLVHHLAFWKEREEQSVNEKSGEGGGDEIPGETFDAEISGKAVVSAVSELLPVDPFAHLAKAAGYDDPELWWEVNFENRQHNEEVFAAVKEAVSVLREYFPKTDRETLLREAWMRKMIQTYSRGVRGLARAGSGEDAHAERRQRVVEGITESEGGVYVDSVDLRSVVFPERLRGGNRFPGVVRSFVALSG